jgi:hypothetical protein
MVRSELASSLVAVYGPEGNEDAGSTLLGRCEAKFLKFRLAQETPVPPFPDDIDADAAAFSEVTEVLGKQLGNGV